MSFDLSRNFNSLEDEINLIFIKRQARLQTVSSELRISAMPNYKVEGKRKKRKISNLYMTSLEEGEYQLEWKRKKLPYHVIFALACQSWYMTDDLRTTIQFLILEERKRWNLHHSELDLVLKSKAFCLLYLQEQMETKGSSWIYSYILADKWQHRNKEGKEIIYSLYEILPIYRWHKKKKPLTTNRVRGYRDHGSLGDSDVRARRDEWQKDYQNRLEEEELLKKQKEFEDTTAFLEGWLY